MIALFSQTEISCKNDITSKDLRKKFDEEIRKINHHQDDDAEQEADILGSRVFAISLICIASLYVLIMIFQAYLNNQNYPGSDDNSFLRITS